MDTDPYVKDLLGSVVSLRKVCKNGILTLKKGDVWVPDLFGKMILACNGLSEQAIGWKQIAAADGVHLVPYEKMASVVFSCVKNLLDKSKDTVASSVSAARNPTKGSFYWRGFLSPVGSARPKNNHAVYMLTNRGGGGGGGGKMRGFPDISGRGRGTQSRPPYYRKN